MALNTGMLCRLFQKDIYKSKYPQFDHLTQYGIAPIWNISE